MPAVNVEFYRPTVHRDHGRSFTDVMQRIGQMTAVQRIRRGLDPAAVLSLDRNGNEYIGEAARIRMEDLPSIIDVATGQRQGLNVGTDEGLGEEIHFLYDADLNVIAVQRKGHFRASALRDLFSDLTETMVEFQIILRSDAWQRFQQMGLVRKIYFKLARPHDVEGQRRPALIRIFEEMDEFDGVSAKIEISVGRQRERGLRLNPVRHVVAWFRAGHDDFKALSITGAMRDEEGERQETVDFVKGRLEFSADVPRRGRRLDPEGCRLALRRAIRANRPYLRTYIG